MQDRLQKHPIHYLALHIIPTLVWCVAMPIQQSNKIRYQRPRVHRASGYVAATMSLVLALSGLAFTARKRMFGTEIAYSHRDWSHLHTLKVKGRTLLVWPTFEASLMFIGPAQLYSLIRLVVAARAKRYLEHQTWSVLYTIFGFTIALQRVAMLGSGFVGIVLNFGVSQAVRDALGVPKAYGAAQWDAELSAFALTTLLAFVGMAGWLAYTVKNGRLVLSQRRPATANGAGKHKVDG